MIDFDNDMKILEQVKQYELLFNELNDFYIKVKPDINSLNEERISYRKKVLDFQKKVFLYHNSKLTKEQVKIFNFAYANYEKSLPLDLFNLKSFLKEFNFNVESLIIDYLNQIDSLENNKEYKPFIDTKEFKNLLESNSTLSLKDINSKEKEIFIKHLNNNNYTLLGKKHGYTLSATLRELKLDIPYNQKMSFNNFNTNTFSKNIGILKKIIEDRFAEEFNKTSLYKIIRENFSDNQTYNNKLKTVLENEQILTKYALNDNFRQNLNYFLVTILSKADTQISYQFINQYSLSKDFMKKISKSTFQSNQLKETAFSEVMEKVNLNEKLSSDLKIKKTKSKNKI